MFDAQIARFFSTLPPAMTAFVTSLRSRPETIVLGKGMTIRVEMAEVWDAVRIETPSHRADFGDQGCRPRGPLSRRPLGRRADFVVKLNGYEILDESDPGLTNRSHRRLDVAGDVPSTSTGSVLTVAFISHADCGRHDTGWGHPEHVGRLRAITPSIA